jgi:hypothetical protein
MAIGNLVLPANIAPGSPMTWEMGQDLFEQLAGADNASGLTAHGTAISDATTNQALISVPSSVISGAAAGNVFTLAASLLLSAPSSGAATVTLEGYSGGSSGTSLGSLAFTPTASAASALAEVMMRVNFYSATTAQCIIRATVSSSNSTSAAAAYLGGNASATPVTMTKGQSLTLNALMGSAVSGSIFEQIDGYWGQVA